MHPRTIATLDTLEAINWFNCVGKKDVTSAIVLSSWEEAIEHCSSPDWEELCLEAVNQYCERLTERSINRFNRWNEIVSEIKSVTMPFVSRKIEQSVYDFNLPQVFEDTVQWDVLHLCMESEYADVYPPGFYASQAYWYVSGHFPCGWDGDFPQGTLIIY